MALGDHPYGMFEGQHSESVYETKVSLPALKPIEQVLQDYATTTFSIKAHPLSFLRQKLNHMGVSPAKMLAGLSNGMLVKVCGIITVRQRPGTAKGVLFVTIEDETGFVNLVLWSKTFETYRKVVLQSKIMMATRQLQIEGDVVHVIVHSCKNMNTSLLKEAEGESLETLSKVHPDVKKRIAPMVQGQLFSSRDFK